MPATISVNFANQAEVELGPSSAPDNKSVSARVLAQVLGSGGVTGGYVTIAGAQTITGAKTFSAAVTLNTAPTLAGHATTKSYVDGRSGVVQLSAGTGISLNPVGGTGTVTVSVTNGIPTGGIIMWSGAIINIPTGWALCNGANGTPDLRNRFIVGAGSSYAVAATGGQDQVTLTIANLPAHTHTLISGSTTSTGAHTHRQLVTTAAGSVLQHGAATINGNAVYQTGKSVESAGTHQHSLDALSLNNTGSGTSFDNKPLYYALAFIMKL